MFTSTNRDMSLYEASPTGVTLQCVVKFPVSHNSLFASVYYLPAAFDLQYRSSSGHCTI